MRWTPAVVLSLLSGGLRRPAHTTRMLLGTLLSHTTKSSAPPNPRIRHFQTISCAARLWIRQHWAWTLSSSMQATWTTTKRTSIYFTVRTSFLASVRQRKCINTLFQGSLSRGVIPQMIRSSCGCKVALAALACLGSFSRMALPKSARI